MRLKALHSHPHIQHSSPHGRRHNHHQRLPLTNAPCVTCFPEHKRWSKISCLSNSKPFPSIPTKNDMTRVANTPSNRPEVIQSLIDGVDRYNPDNVSILEEYLATQCSNREVDVMANLAILKLYQFNPHLINDQVVNNILVKALTTLPEPDFNLCLYLLNEQMVTEEPVVRLITLRDLIEQARFKDFWNVYEGGDEIYKELTAEVLGFEDSIRKNIATAVMMTFQSIEAPILEGYLHLKDQAFSDFVKAQGWTEANGVVSIPINKDNVAKTTVLTENIKFEQLTKIIGHSND